MLNSILLLNVGVGEILNVNYEVYFWILMGLSIVLIAVAKTSNQEYIGSLFSTALINRTLLQRIQEDLKLGSTSSISLTAVYFFNLAILLSYISTTAYGSWALLLLAILVGAALVKWLIIQSFVFVTENRAGVMEHGMNHLIYYQVTGLILTPILFLTHFFDASIYHYVVIGCLIFCGLAILFREIQSIARALKARVSPLYIILYLCTLELMPLVLIIYAFVTNSNGLN